MVAFRLIRPLALAALSIAAYAATPPARIQKTIDRDWTFQYFPQTEPDMAPAAPDYRDSAWPAVGLPHTWSTYETTSAVHPFIQAANEGAADRVTYATEYGMRVPAIVYHSSNQSIRRPALIVVNGHGGDKYSWYSVYSGILFARAGAVVLTYDPIGEGERNIQHKSGTRQHDRYVPPDENGSRD